MGNCYVVRDTINSSVVFYFYVFAFLFLYFQGLIRKIYPPLQFSSVIPEIFDRESTEEDVFSSSVVFVFYVFYLSFNLFRGIIKGLCPFIVRGYEGACPTEEGFSLPQLVFSLFFCFSGGYEGACPLIVDRTIQRQAKNGSKVAGVTKKGNYKGVCPTEGDSFSSSVVLVCQVLCFFGGL